MENDYYGHEYILYTQFHSCDVFPQKYRYFHQVLNACSTFFVCLFSCLLLGF